MKIDRTALDRLLSLDDVTLAKTIRALAMAAGIDRSTAEAANTDLPQVRARLSHDS